MENRKWGVRIMEAKKYRRIFTIVVDSCGIGGAKDAERFGDAGTDTLGHIAETVGNLSIPNMQKLGIANLKELKNIAPVEKPMGYFTRLSEASNGKDTMTGHWEMMGIKTEKPFKTFLETGFPDELIREIEQISGRKVIGNKAASGTEIIKELGEEQIKTGALIVYTSADSVLQIAAHEDIIPLDELYSICEKVRKITMKEEWKVGRIIARPYIGEPGNFTRTPNRHDYALNPAHETVLDYLKQNQYSVIAIGKISDIFNNCGITESTKTKDNLDGINQIKETIQRDFNGLCFANLNDYDSKYGHRRDVEGYAKALKEFDDHLPEIISLLKEDDLLMITADHGNDPTFRGTDHTRENTPVIFYSKKLNNPSQLPILKTFSDIGATIADNFSVQAPNGESILDKLI